MRLALLAVAVAGALAGCATPAPHYYSLQVPGVPETAAAPMVDSGYAISVQPVLVPEQVARPQIVVGTASGTEVVPLNAALWAGPLEAQIRGALANALAQRLNVLEVGLSKAAEALPVWRIYVDVQRFDSLYGEAVRQDVVWRLVPQGMPAGVGERLCSAQLRFPVGAGMSALVEGHSKALVALADVIAQSLPGPAGAGASPAAEPAGEGVAFRGCVG